MNESSLAEETVSFLFTWILVNATPPWKMGGRCFLRATYTSETTWSWVEEVGAGSCSLSTGKRTFPTKRLFIGAQIVNFAAKFPKMGNF